jgi:hypothetical protein
MSSQLLVEPYEVTESRIQQVIDILSDRGDDKLNLAAAACEFRVPVRRLRARWAGQQSKQERPGTNKRLSEDEELVVCLYLDRLEAIGTAARKQMITGCANDILRRGFTPSESDTEPPKVGLHWTRRFLERHPEFKVRKQRNIDSNRKNAHDPESFEDWFRRYKALVDEKGIQPGDIYNFDETGFRIGVGKDQWIVTRDS